MTIYHAIVIIILGALVFWWMMHLHDDRGDQ